MLKITKYRVIVSGKMSARENMAIDEALLNQFSKKNLTTEKLPILRLYHWYPNSVSFGISQSFSSYTLAPIFKKNRTKRITGGGILFHGHDLSYALLIPSEQLKDKTVKESYRYLCGFLLHFYKNLGLEVSYAQDDPTIKLSKSDYCQIGYEAYDIICEKEKLGGNAQRWTKKTVFQHGSIPLHKTNQAKKFEKTLEDLSVTLSFKEATVKLIDAFKEVFQIEVLYSTLTKEEEQEKEHLLEEKYKEREDDEDNF